MSLILAQALNAEVADSGESAVGASSSLFFQAPEGQRVFFTQLIANYTDSVTVRRWIVVRINGVGFDRAYWRPENTVPGGAPTMPLILPLAYLSAPPEDVLEVEMQQAAGVSSRLQVFYFFA